MSDIIAWMPYEEYIAQKEWLATMEVEQIQRMRYFFWNNFSHKGYEDWKQSQIENDK